MLGLQLLMVTQGYSIYASSPSDVQKARRPYMRVAVTLLVLSVFTAVVDAVDIGSMLLSERRMVENEVHQASRRGRWDSRWDRWDTKLDMWILGGTIGSLAMICVVDAVWVRDGFLSL